MSAAVSRAALLALAACAPVTSSDDCESFKVELSHCLGSKVARLDCSTVADADVRRLRSLMASASCELIASALPMDGNLTSATCRALDIGCVAALTPAPLHTPTRYPILLVNGIDTSPFFRYSDRIVSMLQDDGGQTVRLATLPPWETPQHRAPELLKLVQAALDDTHATKVNLVCHSLGGLDCRYLVSPAGLGADLARHDLATLVASITTVGTAHRGTRSADVLLGLIPGGDRGTVVNDFATFAGDWFTPDALEHDVHLRDALHTLTTVQATAFNAEIVDDPAVYYQSFAGVSHPLAESNAAIDARARELCAPDEPSAATASSGANDDLALTLVPLADVVSGKTTTTGALPHDGLVTVDSAKWGNFRGCVPADHMEQLGQYNLPDVNVTTGVDIARFYTAIAADLAKKGF